MPTGFPLAPPNPPQPRVAQRKLEISYKCATFKDVVESDKPLFRLAEELARGWLVLPDRIINASMIEQIVEVKENAK
jgi:hypothetical protein